MNRLSFTKILGSLLIGVSQASVAQAPKPEFVSIGTGTATGVYYSMGGAICRTINKYRKQQGLRCSVRKTPGSVANVAALRDARLDLALVQADVGRDTQKRSADATDETRLRSVLTLYSEVFTIVVRADSGIGALDDLRGKRVSVGAPGSGNWVTLQAVLNAKGWSKSDFTVSTELRSAEQSQALCKREIDAFVLTIGHPAGSVKHAASQCKLAFLAVEGPAIDTLIDTQAYYFKTTLPAQLYRGVERDVSTIGVNALLMSSADVPEKLIYLVVKDIFTNLASIKAMHPALKHLSAEAMMESDSTIPVHAGARKYFSEIGL